MSDEHPKPVERTDQICQKSKMEMEKEIISLSS